MPFYEYGVRKPTRPEMQLSKNFSLRELTRSQTAIRKGIKNEPDQEQLMNLVALTVKILQPCRDQFGSININSGLFTIATQPKHGTFVAESELAEVDGQLITKSYKYKIKKL